MREVIGCSMVLEIEPGHCLMIAAMLFLDLHMAIAADAEDGRGPICQVWGRRAQHQQREQQPGCSSGRTLYVAKTEVHAIR